MIGEERVLVGVQHPGEGRRGASADNPASTWPDGLGKAVRPAVVTARPKDGGRVGCD